MNRLERITFVGTAKNAKLGAVLVTKEPEKVYYIDKLDEWDEQYLNQNIIVTGELQVINEKKKNEEIQIQAVKGTTLLIKKAKWKLK